MSYEREIATVNRNQRVLISVIFGLLIAIILLVITLARVPSSLDVNFPPDLSNGGRITPGEVYDTNVYDFAFYIWQQLNRWRKDGSKDAYTNLHKLSAMMTDQFQHELKAWVDDKNNKGELKGRKRLVQVIPGHGYSKDRVQQLSGDSWVVWLDLELIETQRSMNIKTSGMRYPLRIVRYDVDRELNPWRLAIDGFYDDLTRIDLESLEAKQ